MGYQWWQLGWRVRLAKRQFVALHEQQRESVQSPSRSVYQRADEHDEHGMLGYLFC